jgi:hypothetical protein
MVSVLAPVEIKELLRAREQLLADKQVVATGIDWALT